MDIAEALQEATETGEVLTIAYHGGSQPGTTREIAPIRLDGDSVRARCYTSGAVKLFKIAKIEILSSSPGGDSDPSAGQNYDTQRKSLHTMAELQQHVVEDYRSIGWTVECDEDSLRLFDHFKNGKPRKTPALSLFYDDETSEAHMVSGFRDDEPLAFETRRTDRAWRVLARTGSFSSFKHFHKAAEKFISLSKTIPIKKQ